MKLLDLLEQMKKSETAELFDKTATAQRGLPERLMGQLQFLAGGGVFSFVVEHVGDLTHRMSEKFDYMKGGHEYVQDKVEKTLRVLEHRYGFQREMKENFQGTYTYRRERGELQEYETYEEFLEAIRKLSQAYADAHRKVPVFNEPQKRARAAAVALGNWDFTMAKLHLNWLKRLTDDREAYQQAVSQVTTQESMTEDAASDINVSEFSRHIFELVKENLDALRWQDDGILYGYLGQVIQRAGIQSRNDFKVPPPDWVSMDNLDDLIVVIAPVEEEKERGGVRTKRAGGFGHTQMDGGRKPVIVLFALNPEDPQKYAKDRLSGTKRTFVHEFTHYLDSIRGAKGDAAKMADAGDMSGYYLNPTEFNAHFQEVAEGIWSLLNAPGLNPQALAKVRNHYLGKGFEGFYEQFKRDMPNDYQAPFSKYRNKVARRVYKLYTEIVSRLEQEEPKTEGMDNNFFLSKSDVSSAEYPLPDDATKYRNINSKKRGAKKPKVRTDSNSFERIA